MNADFLDAHNRHWADAELLRTNQRWANADQLYGVATECGLKKLMTVFGMPVDNNSGTPSNREDRVHINKLWSRYESYQAGRQGTQYSLFQNDPFNDWDIAQRYANRSNFDDARVNRHRRVAEIVRDMINKAKLEGLFV